MAAVVPIPELRDLIVARLNQRYSSDDSERMADVVLFGDLIGRPSHGILRLLPGSYGAMDEEPGPPPTVRETGPAAASIEGRPGMLVASLATELVTELALEHGTAVVSTRGSHSTSGSLTFYVEQLTNAGLIAFASGNTLSIVTPPGGRERILGTNPLAVGVPAERYPFIMDMATSAITGGEVVAAASVGAELAPNVAVDARGEPTMDPQEMLDGGALLPFGGHKGLGLAMMVELLSGVVAGSAAAPVGPSGGWGHVFVAISLASLGDAAQARQRAQGILDRLMAVESREQTTIRIPGHRSLAARDAAIARGTVEVDQAVFDQLVELVEGQRLDIAP